MPPPSTPSKRSGKTCDLPGESKKCIHHLIKRSLQNKTTILTKLYFSDYQLANLNFDISLEVFGANLAEIFKFRKDRLLNKVLKNGKKRCIQFFLKMTFGSQLLAFIFKFYDNTH